MFWGSPIEEQHMADNNLGRRRIEFRRSDNHSSGEMLRIRWNNCHEDRILNETLARHGDNIIRHVEALGMWSNETNSLKTDSSKMTPEASVV